MDIKIITAKQLFKIESESKKYLKDIKPEDLISTQLSVNERTYYITIITK